ncbi:MAG TPA: glycogen synthase GlgA [Acidisarcina sp.]
MKIVFAASESLPYARTGGLADVIDALPREIARQGHTVSVYLPLYRQVQSKGKDRKVLIPSLTIPFADYNRFAAVIDGGIHGGVQIYFIDCPELFDREYMYETPSGYYGDNWERFALYSRAVLESTKQLGVPDVFHVHDWEAAMLPVYLGTVYQSDPALRKAATVLTVHNAGNQGIFSAETTQRLLLPAQLFTADRLEFYNQFNFLKGGILYADAVTTVSPHYAKEVQTPEFGNRLDGVFRSRSNDLHGILNGVDYAKWDPATDGNIAAHYTPENLQGKVACRRDLLHAFGLDHVPEDAPVLGVVSRFSTRTGSDLLAEAADRLAAGDVKVGDLRVVIIGSGEPYYEGLFKGLAERYPKTIAVRNVYDETLAHKVEAGSDMFLMPSHYEPGGLGQIYGLKYGTVPVVHATGGLEDTVEQWNPETGEGTGFKFAGEDAGEFLGAIQSAVKLFRDDRAAWQKLMRNGMAKDFSWAEPARQYIATYEEVVRRRS